jgi:DNA repair exonuclease SbcCD ATPase subunit
LETNYKEKLEDYQKRIEGVLKNIEDLNEKRETLEKKLEGVDVQKYSKALEGFEKNLEEINKKEIVVITENRSLKKQLDFIKNNDVCPTCKQPLNESYKDEITSNITLGDEQCYSEKKKEISENIEKIKSFLLNVDKILKAIVEINSNIDTYNKEIKFFNNEIKKLNDDFSGDHNIEISNLRKKLKELENTREELKKKKTIIDVALVLLKDDGIKSSIIRRYVSLINEMLRNYLEKFDFFVNFTLNENFEEEFKSRHVDKFSYLNFSEGEKKRIDLALLLTLKEISRKKNNISCNLLAFDETLERVDEHGADCFVKILRETNTNNLIISHSDFVINKFNSGGDCVIRVFKKNKFSYYQILSQ